MIENSKKIAVIIRHLNLGRWYLELINDQSAACSFSTKINILESPCPNACSGNGHSVTASVFALLVSVVITALSEHVLLFVLAMASGPILPAVSDTENKQAVLVVNVTKDGRAIGAK